MRHAQRLLIPFLTTREWVLAITCGATFAIALGIFYIGMLWLGGGGI